MLVLAYMGVLSLLLCPMQSAFPTRRPSFDSARNRHTNHQRCSRTPPLSRSTLLNPAPTASSNNSAVISSSNAAGVASIPLTLPTLFVRSDIFDKKDLPLEDSESEVSTSIGEAHREKAKKLPKGLKFIDPSEIIEGDSDEESITLDLFKFNVKTADLKRAIERKESLLGKQVSNSQSIAASRIRSDIIDDENYDNDGANEVEERLILTPALMELVSKAEVEQMANGELVYTVRVGIDEMGRMVGGNEESAHANGMRGENEDEEEVEDENDEENYEEDEEEERDDVPQVFGDSVKRPEWIGRQKSRVSIDLVGGLTLLNKKSLFIEIFHTIGAGFLLGLLVMSFDMLSLCVVHRTFASLLLRASHAAKRDLSSAAMKRALPYVTLFIVLLRFLSGYVENRMKDFRFLGIGFKVADKY